MEGAAQTLVTNVGLLVGEEFRQLSGVGGEVARLRNELATINALLRMESEADEGAVNHFVREWMKQLREVGYDAEDCIHLYRFRVKCRASDPFFARCRRLLTTLWSRHRLATDIRDLRALAASINEHHARYGVSLESLLLGGRHVPGASRRVVQAVTAVHHSLRPDDDDTAGGPNHLLVGVGAQATVIADKVKALNGDHDKKLKVLSIVGFGGLGKTTLAMEVCRQLKTEFRLQAQVFVSQTFSAKHLKGLLKSMLRQIPQNEQTLVNQHLERPEQTTGTTEQVDVMDVDKLKTELENRLKNNRYLILVDDVWNIADWDLVRSKLPINNCGSRIIVTTRNHTVAKACSDSNDDYIHHMQKLEQKDSEQLFISKAFGPAGNPCPKDRDLQDTIKSILRKCGGLPLTIVSTASSLASYKPPEGKNVWKSFQRSISSQMEINPTLEGMRQILTLSYNHLPHHLKACMMYLSIFPDDFVICKDRLLKRWIAEGLVAEKRGLTQMELAEEYLNELVSRSMIDWADGKKETCKVHDMMLEILVSKSLETNFVSLVGGQYQGISYTNTIRRLSVHGGVEAHNKGSWSSKKNKDVGGSSGIKGMVVQHVRSLSTFDPEVNKELLGRLADFTLLRVLDLEDCKGLRGKHLECICRMYLLRFLSLNGTDVEVMPRRVGDLEHLQTLDVRRTNLKGLPGTIKRLEKLEHLLFSGKSTSSYHLSGWKLTQGIMQMKALRQVNRAAIYDSKAAEEIGELEQLEELAIYVDTREEILEKEKKTREDMVKVVENLSCSLRKMRSLRWLEVGNFGCGKWIDGQGFDPIMDFLNGVESPPKLLRYLKIWGRMHRLPDWVGSLTDLVECEIMWTYLDGVQLLDVLCRLPNLKRLFLGAYFTKHIRKMVFCGEQQVRKEDEEEMVAVSGRPQPLPKLEELVLGYSPETPLAYVFKEGCMPKLKTLGLHFGDQGKDIVGIKHLKNLKEVQCDGSKSHFKGALAQVEELNKKKERESEQITVTARYDED
ncbi:hypothetical protein BS78_09G052700 [Paspalum vaginatum]|nr:hypothetical protein BS78_09G052700 [Paspalum vaginatum]